MSDGHPGQMAAMKLCIDRVLPISLFEKDAKGGRSAVQINITGLGAEIKEIEEEDEDIPGFEVTDVEVTK
jgi:hypothetical protein